MRVAASSPGRGSRALYTSTSSAIFDSSTMRSARTISWIWNQTVARFSNTNVRSRPTETRLACFSSTISRRRATRTFSYSTRLRISDVSHSFMASRLEPVGRGEDLDRMLRPATRSLGDLERRQRTVRRGHGRAGRHRVEQRLGELHREFVIFGLEPPGAVDRRALLD